MIGAVGLSCAAANEEAELAVAKARSLGLLADESSSPLAPAPAPWMSELRRHISNEIDRARLQMIISMLKRIVFMMKMIMPMWEIAMFVMQMIMWIFKMIIFMIKGPEMIVLKVQMRTSLLKIIMCMIKKIT